MCMCMCMRMRYPFMYARVLRTTATQDGMQKQARTTGGDQLLELPGCRVQDMYVGKGIDQLREPHGRGVDPSVQAQYPENPPGVGGWPSLNKYSPPDPESPFQMVEEKNMTNSPDGARTTVGSCEKVGNTTPSRWYSPCGSLEVEWTTIELANQAPIPQCPPISALHMCHSPSSSWSTELEKIWCRYE